MQGKTIEFSPKINNKVELSSTLIYKTSKYNLSFAKILANSSNAQMQIIF